jgi:hypothetical protein
VDNSKNARLDFFIVLLIFLSPLSVPGHELSKPVFHDWTS